jgi:4-O-beta-D-mannosyl-D-glucose phosphorylase
VVLVAFQRVWIFLWHDDWHYDLNQQTNPLLMERMGINTVFNPGVIELSGTVYLAARVEGADRKSFFAIAESRSSVDRFRFWDYPLVMPETSDPDINVYDLRLVKHEDGWIYGLFCTERKDPAAPRRAETSPRPLPSAASPARAT